MRPISRSQTAPVGGFSDPRQAKRFAGVLQDAPSKAAIFRRVYSGTASPREAIKAMCLDCVGLSEVEVRECPATACPLWRFRPYQLGKSSAGGNA